MSTTTVEQRLKVLEHVIRLFESRNMGGQAVSDVFKIVLALIEDGGSYPAEKTDKSSVEPDGPSESLRSRREESR